MLLTHDQLTALAIGGAVIGALWLLTAALRLVVRAEVARAMRAYIIAGSIQPRDKRGRFRAR